MKQAEKKIRDEKAKTEALEETFLGPKSGKKSNKQRLKTSLDYFDKDDVAVLVDVSEIRPVQFDGIEQEQ